MENQPKTQLLVWWVLWGAFMVGIFQIFYFLGVAGDAAKQSSAPAQAPLVAALGLIPVAVSFLIRWVALPRIQIAQTALAIFILGIAFAEATCFLGIFIFPAYKVVFFAFSVLGIFQFIPVFAHRYYAANQ